MQRQVSDGVRLSPQQRHLWALRQNDPESSYTAQSVTLIEGRLSRELLGSALRNVVGRHEILRTSFDYPPGSSSPLQFIDEGMDYALVEYDLVGLETSEQERTIEELARKQESACADAASSAPLRISLVKLSEERHLLLMTLPALCADSATLGNLFREVCEAYAACASGGRAAGEVMQYAELAEWQNNLLESEETERGRAYWRDKPRTAVTSTLPLERRRDGEADIRRVHALTIDEAMASRLHGLAGALETPPTIILLACWQTLLWRITASREACVAVAFDGRKYEEVRDVLGPVSRHLPLGCDPQEDERFEELVKRLRRAQDEVYKWQEYFDPVATTADAAGDIANAPYGFEFVELPDAFSFDGLTFSCVRLDACRDGFKAKLRCAGRGDGFALELIFDARLFGSGEAAENVRYFAALLDSALRRPEAPLSDLEILQPEQRERLLVEFNRTEADYALDRCVHQLFEAQAERAPASIAVTFKDQRLTYAELNERANRLAHYLRKMGVGPEVPVAICVERSVEMLVGLLGILKAGGAYVQLDPTYPTEHLNFTLEDSQAPVLLTQESLVEKLPAQWAYVFRLDADWAAVEGESGENPHGGATADNLAYVIYTSGSTGQPKAVEIQHGSLLNLVTWHQRAYGVTPEDRATQLAGLAFDASVWEIWPYLTAGAGLLLADEDVRVSASRLVEWLAAERVSLCFLPTPLAESVLKEQWPPDVRLRALLTGGDKLHNAPPRGLSFQLVNHYGPTENTVVATCTTIPPDSYEPPPIGRPIANTEVYVLDHTLRPLPPGLTGELYIGGHGLARGYLSRPALTAERFIPHPFSTEPGARLYRTGDMVRWQATGELEFVGRADEQVKVRGFRIEPGEIEAVLRRHAGVREAVVVAREGRAGSERRLVAYVVAEDGVGEAELREHLAERLPAHMVPAAYAFLEQLPLTRNGKIDKAGLPEPERRVGAEGEQSRPRNEVEETLAGVWAEVLGAERVGIHDNFFELGGDSIIALQVVARAGQSALYLTTKQIFQYQTIAELSPHVGTVRPPSFEQGVVSGDVPLTPIQKWLLEQNLAEPHHWNMSVLLEVTKELDDTLLAEAVRHLTRHHDALRMRFVRTPDGWYQFNAGGDDDAPVPFLSSDLSLLSENEQVEALEREAEQYQASLNLSEGPLLRVVLFRFGAGKPDRLLFIVHHLVVDGVSWRVLIEDLRQAYELLERGEEVQLPPKTASFKQWAETLIQYAQSDEVLDELTHWLDERRWQAAPLPVDYPDGQNLMSDTEVVALSLTREETQILLKEMPAAYQTQANEPLLAALAQALSRWTGSPRVQLLLEGHGREAISETMDVSRTVGWFTTLFPVVLDVKQPSNGSNSLKEVLLSTKEQLRSIPGRGFGYGALAYLTDDEAVRNMMTEFAPPELSFNYLGQADQTLPSAGVFRPAAERGGHMHSPRAARPHLLDITCLVVDEQLQVSWTYGGRVHRRETIAAVAGQMMTALRALLDECRRADANTYTPSDFPLAQLSQQELNDLMDEISS